MAPTEVPPAPLVLPAWQEAIEHAPAWMRWSAVALVAYSLFLFTPTGAATYDTGAEQLASAVRLVIEGAATPPEAAAELIVERLRAAGWLNAPKGE